MKLKLTQKEFKLIIDALVIAGAAALDNAVKKAGTKDYKKASDRAEDFLRLGERLCELGIKEGL